ncbi:hypothetical protein BKA62DRAFT_753944 [Auriculariales sp. MPI-PUGE-AT-0066]|nr:hypothetical protein BKA62DRAFT_753944 [Auriculariales sp. MPI-PUGE-AT-0066]
MMLAGASPILLLRIVALLLLAPTVLAINAVQVGNPAAGLDIRIPLNAFQCSPWLIYYNVSPNDVGRSLGIDYDDVSLQLTTPDSSRRLIVKLHIPKGEGVISWTVNMKTGTRFYVVPHGAIEYGEYVSVIEGDGGSSCFDIGTKTTNDEFVTYYDTAAYHSIQDGFSFVSTRFSNQIAPSPSVGLQTRYAAAGVVVTPTQSDPTPDPTPEPPPSNPPVSNPPADPGNSFNPSESTISSATAGLQETVSSQPDQSDRSSNSASATRSQASNFWAGVAPSASTSLTTSGPGVSSQINPGNVPESSGHKSSNIVPIAVGSVGGVFLLLLATLCGIIIRRRRRSRFTGSGIDATPFLASDMTERATIASTTMLVGAPIIGGPDEKHTAPSQRHFFSSESHQPSEPPFSDSSSTVAPRMDLAQALSVVAAHFRSGENVEAGPSEAPPEYDHVTAPVTASRKSSTSARP